MQRILEEYGYDECGVVALLSEGIKLTGHHKLPPYAEQKIIPCTSTKKQLPLGDARTFAGAQPRAGDSEVAMGFMEGPFHDAAVVSDLLCADSWVYTPGHPASRGRLMIAGAVD